MFGVVILMILVLLGTQDKPFTRILKAVSKQIKNGNINEKVVAQIGHTKYHDDKIEAFDFTSKEEIENLIDKARIIITHAGVGNIIECLNKGKKIIVVPRYKKYKEHTNDHQVQITKEFASKNYIIPLYNTANLSAALEELKKFKPLKYESNCENFKNKLKNIIDNI